MAAHSRILVIGFSPAIGQVDDPGQPDVEWIRFSALAGQAEGIAGIELVIAPLVSDDADALEIIEALGVIGFRGRLQIVAPRLPRRQIVLAELRAAALGRQITLELVETGAGSDFTQT